MLNTLIKIKVEFTINDFPGLGIDISRGPTAHSVGSKSPILRGIFNRVVLKQFEMFLA